ncbi:MAG: hypothetical protein EU548_08445, partial [Promethearchaeota archaeon]
MTPKELPESEEILNFIRKKDDLSNKKGLVCLNCILIHATVENIQNFIVKHNIEIPKDKNIFTKFEYFQYICSHFYEKYISNPEIQKEYEKSIDYIGTMICEDPNFKFYLTYLDFISKQDLMEVFADYCADLGITVYAMPEEQRAYTCDLYLVTRSPFLRTEAVFVRTGNEMNGMHKYNTVLDSIEKVAKIATWRVLVTTPMAIYNIGLERVIRDIKQLDTWLYIVDPARKKILGVIKGSKSKDYDTFLRDQFLEKLPRVPIRAQSDLSQISTYNINENDSYNLSDYTKFALLRQPEHDKIVILPEEKPQYENIFNNMMIIEQSSGIPVFTYLAEDVKDQIMFSSFLKAMDDFVSNFGDEESSLQEINYKGFYVLADYSENIKVALFLTKPPDKELKERLTYFANWFEENYKEEIEKFIKSGETSLFEDKKILKLVRQFL